MPIDPKKVEWDPIDKNKVQWDDASQGGQPKPLTEKVIQPQPGVSEQQAFFEKRFKPYQNTIEDLTKGEVDWEGTGAAAGATLGARLGMPFGLPGVVGGAAIGGAGGMAYEQIAKYLQGKGPETSQDALKQINEAAAFGGGAEMAGPAIGQLAKPLSREMGPLAQKIWDTAKAAKMPLPASAFKPSQSVKAFEWFGRALPTGRGVMQHEQKVLLNNLEKMMDDTVSKIPMRVGKYEAGEKLLSGLQEAKETTKTLAKTQYQLWKKTLGEGRAMSNTAKVISQEADSVKSPAIRAYLEAFSGKGENWVAKDIYDYQQLIWKKTYKAMPQLGGKLEEALKKDLGEELYKGLQKGKAAWAQYRKLAENKTIKAMATKYRIDPDNVLYAAFKAGNFDDVALMKSSVKPETWELAKNRFVENIIDTSMDRTKTQFMPDAFAVNFEKFGRQIKNVMPEIYENMNDFYLMVKASQPFTKQMQPLTGMAKMAMQGVAAAGVGASAYVSPWIAVPYGFSASIAHSITAPGGYLKKYLVKGFPAVAEAMKQTTRFGGRAGMVWPMEETE